MTEQPTPRRPEPLIDLSHPRRCHLVGVGGPGMSAIAMLLARMGHQVSGSELRPSDVVDQLEGAGVEVFKRHDPVNVNGADVVVYSTAIPHDHVELATARGLGIPVRHRSGMLASMCAVRRTVAIAGTHGKTTTTALLTHILVTCGMSPSAIVGAEVVGLGVGAVLGDGDLFVLEADESDGTLDVLGFDGVIVTNVDRDHLDYFGSLEGVQQSFVRAVGRASGPIVVNVDDDGSRPVVEAASGTVRSITFGTGHGADVRVVEVVAESSGIRVSMSCRGESVVAHLPLRGVHNALNLAAAMAMASMLGVNMVDAARSVESFPGVARRFTERGEFNGALLVDDYAHLPAEIEAAISAARSHPRCTGRVVAVFQPNRFHRIASMAAEYADCFRGADIAVITEIYASGTTPIEGVSGEMVFDAVRRSNPDATVVWAPERADMVRVVSEMLTNGDVCVSMGCGDIESFPDDLKAGVR